MTFLHTGILAALALTAVPVVLHLLLRQKPKRIDFPALKLVQSRTKRSTKRLRVRHLLLLILRVLLIAGMVFAAARPLLPAADWSPRWWEIGLGGLLVGIASVAHRWWNSRVAANPGQATREQLAKRGQTGIWSVCGLIALLAIGLPYANRVRTSMREAPTAEDLNLPIAGVVVFDVSASMSYRQAGQTLLDVGRQIVADHVGALPEGSRICVTDNATDQPLLFQMSLSSVPSQLERLSTSADARVLNSAIADALNAQVLDRDRIQSEGGDRDRYVRRIYVVTDLAKSAWQFPDPFELESSLSVEEAPSLFVLDVGSSEGRNRGFSELSLSTEEMLRGGSLRLMTRYESTMDESASAEMFVSDGGDPVRLANKELGVGSDSVVFTQSMSFKSDAIQGRVQLTGSDPLDIDDSRFFTVGVTPLPNVLLVADDEDLVFALRLALEMDQGKEVPLRYNVTDARSSQLSDRTLQQQDVVCLFNISRLTDTQWGELAAFVRNGGGLAIILGDDSIESFSYNRASAREVLPGIPDVWGSRPAKDPAKFVFVKSDGPFVDRISAPGYEGTRETLESSVDVTRFWRVQPEPDAVVVARFTADALPALISRQVGAGLAMMLCTDASAGRPSLEQWNNLMLPYNGNYWAPLVFFDQMMRHLARVGSERRNFTAGEVPLIKVAEDKLSERLFLRMPDFRNLPVAPPTGDTVSLPDAQVPGHYAIATGGGEVVGRFSVNYRPEESDLTRASQGDLTSVLGEGTFEIATSLEELNEEIDVARFGQEAFPLLVMLAVLFFAAETLLSSRFYGDVPAKPSLPTNRIQETQSERLGRETRV